MLLFYFLFFSSALYILSWHWEAAWHTHTHPKSMVCVSCGFNWPCRWWWMVYLWSPFPCSGSRSASIMQSNGKRDGWIKGWQRQGWRESGRMDGWREGGDSRTEGFRNGKREMGGWGVRETGPPAQREGHSQQGGLESCWARDTSHKHTCAHTHTAGSFLKSENSYTSSAALW